uniref:Uncharacterized protein n=1 Tax=Alcaligenes xylosoxydans xylosoxydans TaxID=85698 RepID=A0A193PMJ4_ALCXX|nr:hypothetical protein [Achromobacter xylosoxidans]
MMLWSSNDVTQQGSRPKTKLEKGKYEEIICFMCMLPL